jgi:hypothetical protein
MKYLPFENYTLVSRLSVEEARRRLYEQLEPGRSFGFRFLGKKTTKPYEGDIEYDNFYINRIIRYRNSFLPMITGHFVPTGSRIFIKIKMRPAIWVLVFMCFWMGVVGLVCLFMIFGAFKEWPKSNGKGFSPMVFIPFIMFLFGWTLSYFSFTYESRKAREFLATLFEGEEVVNFPVPS